MGLGLQGQLKLLRAQLAPSNRLVDIAVQFLVTDHEQRIIERSPVYGGCWDTWLAEYVGEAKDVLKLPCSPMQWELIRSNAARDEASGGRGSGKSEGGVLRCLRMIAERPYDDGQVVSPNFDMTTIVWDKLCEKIPSKWLRDHGVQRAVRKLNFANGVVVRFRSANNPDSLRSWGGGWAFVDEEQDVPTEAVNIIWPSLRKSAKPHMWTCGTPKVGDYLVRHKKLIEDTASHCFSFDSYSNTFVSDAAFKESKKHMDARSYRQEILADWAAVEEEMSGLVMYGFSRDKHGIVWPPRRGIDITREVTKKHCNAARGWVAGVDYNFDSPNVAVLLKVFADVDVEFGETSNDIATRRAIKEAVENHSKQHWVAVHCFTCKGHAGHMGAYLKQMEFGPDDVLVIDDASGQFNRGPYPKSSSYLMRGEGYLVMHPPRNPMIKNAINAVLAKLSPVEGEPTLHVAMPECEGVALSAENLRWKNDAFDKADGWDHAIDALKYPVAYFCPAARIKSGIRGVSIG